jgi:two-component system phosphate regulon sensor histidine kinase PhoR
MKQANNKLTILLIFSSLILLLLLQAFWLRRAYRDEMFGLQREARILFRNTLFEMNDSLMQKSIESLDSLPSNSTTIIKGPRDARTRYFSTRRGRVDTFAVMGKEGEFSRMNFRDSSANVQVYVYSGKGRDTIKNYLRPLMSRIGRGHGPQSFSIRLSGDSLKTADVEKQFHTVLTGSGVSIPYGAIHVQRVFPVPTPDFRAEHDHVIFTPSGGFRLEFDNMQWAILKNISPQILFSLFLTLLTSGSFIILYRSIRTQQILMELKNDFISNITHELRTPVTTVGVAIEALKNFKGLDNPKLTSEYLDIAQNELNRLTILTDKILKTAIFENQGVAFVPEVVELDKIVDQVLASMKLVFEKQGAEVSFQKEGDHFTIRGGSVHLTSVIYNLLDNALKYSHDHPIISIRLKENSSNLSLIVEDNGVGIPDEFRKKVFEKFFRVPTGDIHNIKGHGLGLSYVQSVVKAHAGTIEVESEVGKGTTFTIVLNK